MDYFGKGLSTLAVLALLVSASAWWYHRPFDRNYWLAITNFLYMVIDLVVIYMELLTDITIGQGATQTV